MFRSIASTLNITIAVGLLLLGGQVFAQSAKNRPAPSQQEVTITSDDREKLEAYLKKTFSPEFRVQARSKTNASVEVYKGDEFVGVIFVDMEDGEKSFMFNVAILKDDL